MKKKLSSVLLAIFCAVLSVFGLTACKDKEDGETVHKHKLVHTEKIEATETQDGNIEYWYCGGCGKYFSDEAAEKEISLADTVIVSTSHTHNLIYAKKKNSTETQDGNIQYWQCEKCRKYFSDKKGLKEITAAETVTHYKPFEVPENGYDGSAVELTVYNSMGSRLGEVFDLQIALFNVLYPNIKINVNSLSSANGVNEQTMNDVKNREYPNIVFGYADHFVEYKNAKALQQLDSLIESKVVLKGATSEILGLTAEQKSDFLEAFYNEGKDAGDGKMNALPFSKTTEVMYYNKTVFDRLNLSVPATWEETEDACIKLKHYYPNSTPLGYDSDSNLFINMCAQHNSPYVSATGNNYLFDNPKNREFVGMFKDWYDKGYLEIGSYTSGYLNSESMYMSIGSLNGSSHYDPRGKFELGIAPIPQVDPDNPKVIFSGQSLGILKQDNPQEVVASWLFIKFLSTNAALQATYAVASGYLPVIKSAYEIPAYKDAVEEGSDEGYANYFPAVKACMQQAGGYFAPPAFGVSSKTRQDVTNLMVDVLKGNKTIDKAFKDAIANCGQ